MCLFMHKVIPYGVVTESVTRKVAPYAQCMYCLVSDRGSPSEQTCVHTVRTKF